MEDTKKIKTIFAIDATSIIADTEDDTTGEASTGYSYKLDTSMPELAFSIAGFLKAIDGDEDLKVMMAVESGTIGEAFIALIQAYYTHPEK